MWWGVKAHPGCVCGCGGGTSTPGGVVQDIENAKADLGPKHEMLQKMAEVSVHWG